VLFYGEEIGMGENLDIEGRLAVRTPMQWTPNRNGGFSTARASRLPRPIVKGSYGPEHVNVADQRSNPASLLNFMALLIRRYRESPELGWGELRILEQPHNEVLAHLCASDDRQLVLLHNLSAERRTVPVQIEGCDADYRLVDLLQDAVTALDEQGCAELALEGYGYRWLRLMSPESRRLA
jgi:glycosidase